jgi:hypothetical protein
LINRAGAAIVAALLIGGCGESSESLLAVAGIEEILGPYQTEPYQAYDPGMLEALGEECAGIIGDIGSAYRLVLADGRGGGRLMLLYASRNGSAECFGRFDSGGRPLADGGGTSTRDGPPVPLGTSELRAESGGGGSSDGGDAWAYLHGNAGSDIARVVLELADGTAITASLAGGRFAAWWPGQIDPAKIQGYDASGTLVAEQPY